MVKHITIEKHFPILPNCRNATIFPFVCPRANDERHHRVSQADRLALGAARALAAKAMAIARAVAVAMGKTMAKAIAMAMATATAMTRAMAVHQSPKAMPT